MKKALLLTGLLLVLVAPLATAAGVNIAWGTECWGQLTSPSNLVTFACNSNTVPTGWKFTTSFIVDQDLPDYANVNVYVKGVSETGVIPEWWKLSAAGDCRYLATNLVYSASYLGAVGTCADPFSGTASGGGGYGYLTPTVIQQQSIWAVGEPGMPLASATETFASTTTVKNTKTMGVIGTTKCDGCLTGMVFGVDVIKVGSLGLPEILLSNVIEGGNQCIIWQRGFAAIGDQLDQPCNAPVPARNTTWGQVKSLYR